MRRARLTGSLMALWLATTAAGLIAQEVPEDTLAEPSVVPDQAQAKPDAYDAPPKPLKITKPRYPQKAFADRVQGTVVLEIEITTEGTVEVTDVLESIPPLDEAAMRTVREWRFEPALRDGKPVATTARAPVTFRIFDHPDAWITFPKGFQKLTLVKCRGRFTSKYLCVDGTVMNTSRTNVVDLVALLSCREVWGGPRVMHEEALGNLAPGAAATFEFEPERCLKGNVLFGTRQTETTELVPTLRQRWTLIADED